MADLALDFRLPEALVALGLFLGDRRGVVGNAEVAAAHHDRVTACRPPMAGELLPFIVEEIVKGIIGGVELVDVARFVQLLHEFGVGKNDVERAGRRLGDQRQHVVAAGIVLRLELDVVGGLELGNHIGLAMAIPGEHVELDGLRPGAIDVGHRRADRRCRHAVFQHFAAARLGNLWIFHGCSPICGALQIRIARMVCSLIQYFAPMEN